jgi:demethylmenaquinone methyltransferase/2-methoxy-6-polyprenyl-1,4-benzoquinol methylase
MSPTLPENNVHRGIHTAHRFFAGTGCTYDLVVNLFTLGFDLWWKERILTMIPFFPRQVIDQACGTGILTIKVARRFPNCRVIGVELREEYLSLAKQKTGNLTLRNVEFIIGRAEEVYLKQQFDCITSSYLAKYAELEALVKIARKMLRKNGVLILHDFTYPNSPIFLRVWKLLFRFMQLAGSLFFPEWNTVFYELPEFLSKTKWVRELVPLLQANAFTAIRVQPLFMNTSTIVSAKAA